MTIKNSQAILHSLPRNPLDPEPWRILSEQQVSGASEFWDDGRWWNAGDGRCTPSISLKKQNKPMYTYIYVYKQGIYICIYIYMSIFIYSFFQKHDELHRCYT